MERNVSLEDTRKVWICMSRYEVCYFGEFFWGDRKDWWNIYEPYDWSDAWNFYSTLKANGWRVYIKDNDEDVIYDDGEWY